MNKEEFLNDVRAHIEADIPTKPKQHWRSKKLLGMPAGWMVLLISGMLVSGALITILWSNATLTVQNTLVINGETEEEPSLLYDGTMITGDMLITTMDNGGIFNSGDDLTFQHTFESVDGHAYDITIDLQLPDNSDPASLWYGFDIWAYQEGTQIELTEFTVDSMSSYTFDLRYKCNELFEDPGTTDYPFLMILDASIHIPVCLAVDDTASAPLVDQKIHVTLNDQHENSIEIISATQCTPVNVGLYVGVNPNGQDIDFHAEPGVTGTFTFEYTIEDSIGQHDVGLVTVTVT